MQTERLKVVGMTNWGCATVVADALKEMGGVRGVTMSITAGCATVNYDETMTSPEKLKLAVCGAGYNVEISEPLN
jgi:copper chaperone CopZ